ncbi:MAG: hypothetical protein ACREX9_23295 [Gammaproteobacteria bacterium]
MTFATNLPEEYQQLLDALAVAGCSEEQARQWLWVREEQRVGHHEHDESLRGRYGPTTKSDAHCLRMASGLRTFDGTSVPSNL